MITIPLETLQQTTGPAEAVARAPEEAAAYAPAEAAAHAPAEAAAAAHGVDADGTVISVAAARRLACDAGIIPIADTDRGDVLVLAKKRRTISGALKRAMLCRDQTCRFPGCKARAFLEGHHMKHWLDGGKTVLENMLALCSHHHRFVHEYEFKLELRADGTVVAYRPDGLQVVPVPLTPAPPDLGWTNIHRRNERFEITPETVETWDGVRFDYHLLIQDLLEADAGDDADDAPAEARATDDADRDDDAPAEARWIEDEDDDGDDDLD